MQVSFLYTNENPFGANIEISPKGIPQSLAANYTSVEIEVNGFHPQTNLSDAISSFGVGGSYNVSIAYQLTTSPLYNNNAEDIAKMKQLNLFLAARYKAISIWTQNFAVNEHGTLLSTEIINPSDTQKYILPVKVSGFSVASTDTNAGIDTPYKTYDFQLNFYRTMNFVDLNNFFF